MDGGEVIPGLNEDWTFAGAKAMEWIVGVAAALVFQELFLENLGRSMPFLIAVLVATPLVLSSLRKLYPDEERGLRNHFMVMVGFPPPGTPTPSLLQPIWSGAPIIGLDKESEFEQLEIERILGTFEEKKDIFNQG